MSLLDHILRRPKPYKLRKRYDRLREKIDKLSRIEKRIELLKMMDQLEPQVIMMEEHQMSNFEQRKTADFIKATLRRIEFLMKEEKFESQTAKG